MTSRAAQPADARTPGLYGVRAAPPSALLDSLADRVVLFRAGDFIFVTYGVISGIGAFVALVWMSVLLLGLGVSQVELAVMVVCGAAAVVVFSRIAALLLGVRALFREPLRTLRAAAFASWGGILALALTPIVFSWVTGHALLPLMDAIAISAPIGHAIGRIGCLTYGCCHGRPATFPLSITYRDPAAKAVRAAGLKDTPVHASPLYEAAWIVVALAFVNALVVFGAPQGVPSGAYLLLYGAGRLAIEFTRDNNGRRIAGPLAVNHLLALAMAAAGVFLLLVTLLNPSPMPGIGLGSALPAAIELTPLLLAGSLIVLLGFSLQRNRVGEW